jgi:hypothetical protein
MIGMPQWLDWLRGGQSEQSARPRSLAPSGSPSFLPTDLPANVDGSLWASWQARWQEF